MAEGDRKNGKAKKKITDEVRQYVEKRLELFSLTIAEQVSRLLAESFQQILDCLYWVLPFSFFGLQSDFGLAVWLAV